MSAPRLCPILPQVLVTLTALALAAPASAQVPQAGMIQGRVLDDTRAVIPGSAVTLDSEALIGGAQVLLASTDGAFRFGQLPPGTYALRATAPGFEPASTSVRLQAGVTLTLDLVLAVAGVTASTTVEGRRPLIDVKTPGAPSHLDQDQLWNLPTMRSVASLINLVPGINGDVSYGGSQASNALYVDGVSMTEPQYQDPHTRFNYNWVQEVQVVGLGAGAEYGQFTGVAANGILRSGSNRFSGLGEYWMIDRRWMADNTEAMQRQVVDQVYPPRRLLSWWDASLQAGGPILRDQIWFFAGLQVSQHDDVPAGFVGPGSRDERDLQGILKLNMAPAASVRLEGFYERGHNVAYGDYLDAYTPQESTVDSWLRQDVWNLRGTWTPTGRTLVEARYSGYDSPSSWEPHGPGTRSGPPPRYDLATQKMSVNSWDWMDQENRVHTVSATLTHYATGWRGGRHELKAGVEHERTHDEFTYGYPGNAFYYDRAGVPVEVEFWDGYRIDARTARTSMYVRDRWEATRRLTFEPGVRVDVNRGSVPVKGEIFSTSPVSPRIGMAWDIAGDHRTVARVHYGRYADALFSSRIGFAARNDYSPYRYYAIEADGSLSLLYAQDGWADNYRIDEDLEHSSVDQWLVGLERELVGDVALRVQYIRRRFDTFMGLIDTGTQYEPRQVRDPGPDGKAGTADDGAMIDAFNATNPGNQFLVLTNPEDAFNRYDAVQIIGNKRYSRNWQLQASYTWSRNEGTVGNRWHVNAARYDLGSPGVFVNPNLKINAFGRAMFDPTHEAKLLGTYRLPWLGGFNVSGVYRYHTGAAWGRTATIAGFRQGSQNIRIEPRGTRRAPAINQLDMRLEKTVPLGGPRRTLGVYVEAFNLTNQGVPNSELTGPVVEGSGSTFGMPRAWVDPRRVRLGVRVGF